MGFLKKYPIFLAVVVLLLLFLGAGVYLVLQERAKVKTAKGDYQSEVSRLQDVSRGVFFEGETDQMIAPTGENRGKLEERLTQVTGDLQRIRQGMAARSGNLLSDTADEFTFLPKLQSFIASLKARAAANQVKLGSDEAFGFAKYAIQAIQPPKEMIFELNLQRQVLDYIVRKLIESGPTAILSVEREFVEKMPEAEQENRRGRPREDADDDVFTIEELVTARANEFIDTSAYRLVFTGRTDVLRNFVNLLGRFELPLIVRSIQVEPATANDEPKQEERQSSGDSENALFALFGGNDAEEEPQTAQPEQVPGREPVITENKSKFTVVIEYVEVMIDADDSSGEGES